MYPLLSKFYNYRHTLTYFSIYNHSCSPPTTHTHASFLPKSIYICIYTLNSLLAILFRYLFCADMFMLSMLMIRCPDSRVSSYSGSGYFRFFARMESCDTSVITLPSGMVCLRMGRCHPLVQRPADLWSSNLHNSGLRSLVGHNFSGTHFPLVWVRCSVAPRTEQSARTPKEKKSFSEGKGKNYFPLHPKNRICLRSRGSHKTLALPERVVCGRGPLFNCILPLEYFVVTVTSGYIPPRKMPIMDPQQRVE